MRGDDATNALRICHALLDGPALSHYRRTLINVLMCCMAKSTNVLSYAKGADRALQDLLREIEGNGNTIIEMLSFGVSDILEVLDYDVDEDDGDSFGRDIFFSL